MIEFLIKFLLVGRFRLKSRARLEAENIVLRAKMPEDIRRALTGVEITELLDDGKPIGQLKRVRFAQKVPALDSLARHLGMFSESVTQGAGVGFQIILHLGEGEPKPAIDLPRTRTIGAVE